MSSSLKNIFVGLICVGLAGLAYYFITDPGTDLSKSVDTNINGELLVKTQAFINRSSDLSKIKMDVSLFTDPKFVSLRSFSSEIPNQPLGKNDIFSTTQKDILATPPKKE